MDVQVGICGSCDEPVVRCRCACSDWVPIVSQETGKPIMAGIQRPEQTTIVINYNEQPALVEHRFPPGYAFADGLPFGGLFRGTSTS